MEEILSIFETWKPIPGWEGLYEVSDYGRVRSIPLPGSRRAGKILTSFLRMGYPSVGLYKNSVKVKFIYIHQLMMMAFVGPCPPGQEVRHLDGVRAHACLDNLCYGTPSQNREDSRQHGTLLVGSKNGYAKLNEHSVKEIKTLILSGHRDFEIAPRYGVSRDTIASIRHRRVWRHVEA